MSKEKEKDSPELERRQVGVKVNISLWRRLRALAIKEGKLGGELLDEAIRDYLERNE